MISLFFLKAIQTIFICFYFLFLTGIPCVFYTSLLILMFSKHFKTWSYQFKEHLSMFQTLSEWIHEIFSRELCPQTPDTQLSFNFCFTKNGVPILSPGCTTVTASDKVKSNFTFETSKFNYLQKQFKILRALQP